MIHNSKYWSDLLKAFHLRAMELLGNCLIMYLSVSRFYIRNFPIVSAQSKCDGE